MADLIEHLESYLGLIQGGADNPDTPGVKVVWFEPDRPCEGVTTLTTLGLSHHHFTQANGRGIHQELLLLVRTDDSPPNAAGILFQVAAEVTSRSFGLRRGEVIGPRGRLFDRGECTALYAAVPVYLPESFGVLTAGAKTIVMTWLVPITTGEAEFVGSHGWQAFEDLLVTEDPDLTDLGRSSAKGIH